MARSTSESETGSEDLDQEITQEGVQADSTPQSDKHTSMGKSSGVKERPKVATGTTQEIETAYGDLFVTVNNSKHNGPVEIFAQIGKARGLHTELYRSTGQNSLPRTEIRGQMRKRSSNNWMTSVRLR
ncbi:hypothetical protein HRED_03679 [Candidatus Haloredivivus sp. G17]|nr:hypothetical protein HRED_03679 [Candidatus Haloredivivus sp. G17]